MKYSNMTVGITTSDDYFKDTSFLKWFSNFTDLYDFLAEQESSVNSYYIFNSKSLDREEIIKLLEDKKFEGMRFTSKEKLKYYNNIHYYFSLNKKNES